MIVAAEGSAPVRRLAWYVGFAKLGVANGVGTALAAIVSTTPSPVLVTFDWLSTTCHVFCKAVEVAITIRPGC